LIIDKYKRLEEQFDFVLVEGTSLVKGRIELDMNVLIIKTGIPTIIVVPG
jgi:phosphate acetyltransferase